TYNMAVDGMRSFDIYQPLDDKERIEVLTGAAGFLYGVTSPAGMVNFITKRPGAEPLRVATVGLQDEQLYGQLDLGGPLPGRTDLAYRVNLAYADAGDLGAEHQSQARFLASGALDWHLGPDTVLALEAARSRRKLDYAQALFMTSAALGIPDAPDASKNWGAPYTGATDTTTRLGAALDSRLNEVFKLRAKLRYSDIGRSYFLNRQVWQNADLDYKWRVDSQSFFHTVVKQAALFLDADLATGPLRHMVTAGLTRDDYDSGNNGYRGTTYATVYPGNLYGEPSYPAYSLPPAGTSAAQETVYSTFLLADRIALGEHWAVMLGGSRARVDDEYTSRSAAGVETVRRYDEGRFTPAASLSYTPVPVLTAYAAYTESLQQGFTAGSTAANAGEVFAPYVGKQKEVGAKASLAGLNLAVAWFRIDQANQYVDPATNVASQDGRAVHQGWEFTATGKATERLTLTGGFTVLDAEIDKAAANVGKTPQGVPERMARLYAEYDLPGLPGLTLTGGVSYTGKVPWDAANTLYVDAVTVYDAGLRYRTRTAGHDTTWRLNVANLTGEDYWTTRSGILYLGAPRTLSLSASLAF
ncbi:TonB-dependent receptor, partial [Parasulfuritortus cantonensis]